MQQQVNTAAMNTPQGKKKFVTFHEKDNPGVRHVREVLPGEDEREVLMRPTPYDLKMKRIAEENAILEKIPDAEDVMAYARTMKQELKNTANPKIRFPLETYEYVKGRMSGASETAQSLRKIDRIKSGAVDVDAEPVSARPDPSKLKPLNVCPKCKGSFKHLPPHLRHCKVMPPEAA